MDRTLRLGYCQNVTVKKVSNFDNYKNVFKHYFVKVKKIYVFEILKSLKPLIQALLTGYKYHDRLIAVNESDNR